MQEGVLGLLLFGAEGFGDQILEGVFLFGSRALNSAAQNMTHEVVLGVLAGLDKVHHRAEIGRTIGKRGIDKADLGQTDHPITHERAERIVVLVVAQTGLGQFDRAQGAQ